jgi:hypothetical protein
VDSHSLTLDGLPELELPAFDAPSIDVYCWRLEELRNAGYSDEYAQPLAENLGIDLHAACRLLSRGCPVRTAYLILS